MLLIFNTILDAKPRDIFDNTIVDRITFGMSYEILHLNDEIPSSDKFTHLLLTGSELSASSGSEWDNKIISVINSFHQNGKSILGICHGQQMIARALVGDKACRRSKKSEFGWKKMKITKNRIFENVIQPVFIESRYDEVCYLDDRFDIIAANDRPAIQAFQLKNNPVWGVQFHPEMLWEDGSEMVERHLLLHPEDREFWACEIDDQNLVEANLNVFLNFLNS